MYLQNNLSELKAVTNYLIIARFREIMANEKYVCYLINPLKRQTYSHHGNILLLTTLEARSQNQN